MPKSTPRPATSNRRFITAIMIVAIAGAGALGYSLSRSTSRRAVVLDPGVPLPAPQGHVMGDSAAPVEIVMFGDFECPSCGQFTTVTEPDVRARIVKTGKARFRFMDLVISAHKNSPVAHNAASCAGGQGKFWEMHDQIFDHQTDWSDLAGGKEAGHPEAAMEKYAEAVGLDMGRYRTCMQNHEYEPQIRANTQEGQRIGVEYTPTLIIGRRMIPGAAPYDVVRAYVDTAVMEAKARRQHAPQPHGAE